MLRRQRDGYNAVCYDSTTVLLATQPPFPSGNGDAAGLLLSVEGPFSQQCGYATGAPRTHIRPWRLRSYLACSTLGWQTRMNGENWMPGPEAEIVETFVAQLKSSDEVPIALADRLADLLSGDSLPKPQVLVALFEAESGEALA